MTTPVSIWQDVGYSGLYTNVAYGQYATMTQLGFPQGSISSIKVGPFTKVQMYANTGNSGYSVILTGPIQIPDLGAVQFAGATSSISITRVEPTMPAKLACCAGSSAATNCGEYLPGSTACLGAYTGYCSAPGGANIGDPQCQSWCRNNPTICDAAVAAYCAANPASPYCTCITSPAATGGVANPKCVDKKCLDTGYITSTMAASNCPTVVNCDVKNYLTNGGVSLVTNIPVAQNCGATSNATSTTTNVTGPAAASAPPYAMVFVLFMFIVVVMLGLFAAGVLSWPAAVAAAVIIPGIPPL